MTGQSDDSNAKPSLAPETLAAQAMGQIDPVTKALVPPLHASTTFQRDPDGGYSSGRGYTRPHNPTYDEPEDLLTALEGGKDCLLFASGMAAATAVFQALLPGDHVIASRVMYWALRTWLVDFAMSWGLEVEFVDTADIYAVAAAMRPGKTRLIWLETPANPTWEVTDIASVAKIAHACRARVAVDSTVATPVLTRPLEHGADLVVHSASKYLNGHSDVLAGAIICAESDSFWQRIRNWRRDAGSVLGPFEAWLLLRGMRTLFVRVRQSSASALAIARHLDAHPAVAQVLYPGLPDHPGHAVAARQMIGGFSGMLSIRLEKGEAAAMAAAAAVTVFKRATSLGGVESLIEHRASIEGPSTTVPPDLLRLSIGLENLHDLIADLDQALAAAKRTPLPSTGSTSPPDQASPPPEGDVVARIKERLDRQVRPLVADRGGDLVFKDFASGTLTLGIVGSPGASLPLQDSIANILRHYLPEIRNLRLVSAGAEEARPVTAPSNDTVEARANDVIMDQINPALAGHGGALRLVEVKDTTAFVCFEGGCQGCAMAEVTLRQGIEGMVKAQVPEIMTVVDVTDHPSGTRPYFKAKKGPA